MLVWSIISMLLMIFLLQEGFSFSFVSLVILPYLGISFYLGYEHKAARYIMPFYKEVSGSNDVHNSV